MVNPGGTGRPIEAISARFAPLPPNSSRMVALPSVFLPKAYTNLGLRFGEDFLLVFLDAALAIGRNYLFISLKNQGAKQRIETPCGAPIRVNSRFKLAKGPASYWWALLPGSKFIPDAGAENNAPSWQKLGAGLLIPSCTNIKSCDLHNNRFSKNQLPNPLCIFRQVVSRILFGSLHASIKFKRIFWSVSDYAPSSCSTNLDYLMGFFPCHW